MKQAEGAGNAASDRFDAAERALDTARDMRARRHRGGLGRELLSVRRKPGVGERRGGRGPQPSDVDPPLDQGLVRPGGEA